MESYPIGKDAGSVAYEVAYMEQDAHDNKVQYLTEYPTCCRLLSCNTEKQNHGESLMVMAEACQLISIVKGDLDYALRKAEMQLDAGGKEWEIRLYNHVRSQLRRSMLKTFLAGFCISSTQLWVQINILAMRAALNHQPIKEQFQSLLGVLFAMIMFVGRIIDAINILLKVTPWMQKIAKAHEASQTTIDPAYEIRCQQQHSRLKHNVVVLIVMVLISLSWLGYLITKFVGLFVCPYHVLTSGGCMDFSDIVGPVKHT